MPDTETIRALTRRAAALRRHVVTVAASQFAHLGGSMSCADLLAAPFFDYSGFQAGGGVEDVVPLEPLAEKWRAFRWDVREIDGHDLGAIRAALATVPAPRGPSVIVAHTVKGKGVPGIEGTPRAHYTTLTAEEARQTLAALDGAATR